MIELLVVLVVAFALIAAAAILGPRLGTASPLVLVVIGVAASFLPRVGSAHIEPQWILAGVLPPCSLTSTTSAASHSDPARAPWSSGPGCAVR